MPVSFLAVHCVCEKSPLRNTMVQLSTSYINPEHHKSQRHRQTNDSILPTADCTATRCEWQKLLKKHYYLHYSTHNLSANLA